MTASCRCSRASPPSPRSPAPPPAARGVAAAAAPAPLPRRRPHTVFVPLGGSTPLGTLGHVNAALELAEQVAAGALPEPAAVVVPLGSGGTAAGLLLGL